MPDDIVIIGAGGFGREVRWLIERINLVHGNTWHLLGYVDKEIALGTNIYGLPVLGDDSFFKKYKDILHVAIAISSPTIRKKVAERIIQYSNVRFPNLIDPSVIYSPCLQIGQGNIICCGSNLTVQVRICDFVIINPSCAVGHDSFLNSFVTLYPKASETARTGTNVRSPASL